MSKISDDDISKLERIVGSDNARQLVSSINYLLEKPVSARIGWLDDLLKLQLAQDGAVEGLDFDKMFDLTRFLQVILKIREPFEGDFDIQNQPIHLNKHSPLVSVLSDKSEEVLPGSYSLSKKHMIFKLNVYHRIMREFPVVINDEGHPGSNGYGHDVSRLLSLTGVVPRNIGVRPISNIEQRKDHGLTNDLDPLMIQIAKDFLHLMYGIVHAKSIRIEAKSQSGLPLRVHGRGYKTVSFIHAVEHLDEVLRAAKDAPELLSRFDILLSFLQGSRRSPDAAGKKRFITSLSGRDLGLAGDTLQDNKVVCDDVPSAITRQFSTMRYRFVWGGNSIANSIVNAIGTSAREHYGKVYAFTFKHRGREDVLEKLAIKATGDKGGRPSIDQLDLAVIDVSNFDLDYPRQLITLYVDYFKDTPIFDFFARTAFAPSVQGTLDKGADPNEGPILNGNCYDFDYKSFVDSGLPSGWSFVSDAGKMMAPAIYYSLVKAGLLNDHTPEQLDAFLKGECEFAVLNLGDDNVIMGPAGTRDHIYDALSKFCPWKVEPEAGARFIGFPISVDDFGYYNVVHDPASYVTNWLTPERGITSAFRKYWAIGLQQREAVYSDVPITSSFRKIIMEEWNKVYGTNLDSIIIEAAREQREQLASLTDSDDIVAVLAKALPNALDQARANFIMMRVLADPSVLSWQFSADDIYEAFGLDIRKLEGRPPVHFTEKVLTHSGYSTCEAVDVSLDDYSGPMYIHSSVPEEIKNIIINNAHQALENI